MKKSKQQHEGNVKKISCKKEKVTLKMIAQKAGVSISCVARCVNNSGYVSAEKKEHVLKVMKDLHYIPNYQAKVLRGDNSHLLGYIYLAPDNNIFFTKIATSIESSSFERGYGILAFAVTPNSVKRLKDVMSLMLSYGVEGLIFNTGTNKELIHSIDSMLKELVIPAVMIERSANIFQVEKVLINNAEGSYIAVSNLRKSGHRKIAYLGAERNETVEKDRYSGYKMAMQEIDEKYCVDHSYFVKEYSVELGFEKCKEILNVVQEELPTAIFASSDILAAGVYRAIREVGKKIPDDISVVGYDDTIAQFMSPPLSTMRLSADEIAEAALDILLEEINSPNVNTGHKTVMIGPVYIERDSVRNIK